MIEITIDADPETDAMVIVRNDGSVHIMHPPHKANDELADRDPTMVALVLGMVAKNQELYGWMLERFRNIPEKD